MSDILVEVVSRDTTLGQNLGPVEVVLDSFAARADDMSKGVSEIANKLRSGLDANLDASPSAWRLESVELKFSLDLEAEAGIIVTRAKTSAGFEATITWKRSA